MKTFTNLIKRASLSTFNMKRYYLFIIMLLTLGIGSAWAAENVIYTLDGTVTGGSNGYADASTITQSSVSWSVVGNTTVSPWRIGGKSLTNVDRTISSTTAISSGVSKVVVTHGTASSVTVNSVKLIVASDKSFSNVVSTLTGTFTANSSTTFECPADADWTNMFYKLVYNVKITSTNNKYLQFKSAAFYEAAPKSGDDVIVKTLKSISVEGMKTEYEQGDLFSFEGTCTATYSVTKNDVPQEDETKTVTPTVSTPDMNKVGEQTITVSYTDGDETATTTYTIDVTENVVTPGTYTGNLNNTFFGCAVGNNATEQSGKFDDVLVIAGCASNAQTKTNYQSGHVRFYKDSYLQLSVPSGYVIKSIVFTADGDWNGSITATVGAYDNNYKTWTGNAQEVKFSFGAQNRIKNVKVTYAADIKYALNITTPSNGTLTVKDGETEVTDGATFPEGTKLSVVADPVQGYKLDGVTVVDESSKDVTTDVYADGVLTMPAYNITISAAFSVNEKPAATLTLSKNGETEDITGNKQDDVVTLPSTVETDCVKQFVGWSADANCAIEPEYAPGASYTLASTSQTLYAVYATVEGGETTVSVDMETYATDNSWGSSSSTNQKEININSDLKAVISEGGNSGKYYDDGVRIYQTEDATVTISTSVGELKSVKFTFTIANNGTLLHEGVAMTSDEAVEVSGTSAVFSVGDTHATENKGQVRFTAIEVVYTGGATYSNYSTTCSAALANPTFSLEEGKYTETKSVEITATEGTIYYTLDGTPPTASSTEYTGAIALNDCGEYTIKAIAISVDSQSDVVSATYTIKLPLTNSQAAPYTEAEAIAVYDGDCYDNQDVYVKGIVKTATFYNSGTYTITLTNGFQFYKFYKDGSKTLFTDGEINVGDVLVACGKLSKHNTTYQLAEGCYLVEHTPYEGEKTDISNTEATAYTVDQAFALIADPSSDLTKEVYVKGLVAVAPASAPNADGQMTYSISDNGETAGNVLKVYLGLNLNGEKFTSKDNVKLGDYVVVKGKLLDYNSTYELNKGNQLVQHIPAATITIADITMEVGETKTIAATITPAAAESAITYSIKENSANAIFLFGNTITANAVGTATITATIATAADAEYMGKTVDFTVTVNAKSTKEKVVILAKYGDQWYAMMAQYVSGKTSHLAALPVTYVGGKLYNVADADKTLIEWERTVVDGTATFSNNSKYLTGKSDKTDLTLAAISCNWTISGDSYLIGARTFLYNAENNWFRNFGTSNAGNKNYSGMPTVTAPVYATGQAYGRSVNLGTDGYRYGTICLPFGSTNFTGAEFFECVGKEEDKVFIGSVTELEAGVPYIFLASATEVAVYGDGTTAATPGSKNGLVGTFTNDTEVAIGNYILKDNALCQAEAICWVNANRAYLVMEDVPGEFTKMPGRRYIGMDVEGENEATGLDNIQLNANSQKLLINGQLIIIRDGEMYNAMGVRL